MSTSGNNYKLLKPQQKALEINLNDNIYGTFAEIGAGQEVARNFFQVGAAAGTIVKTMSAYDKAYSDAIYGVGNGRYVSEARLYDMLDHEYTLIEERLQQKCDDKTYFVFADTVAAINYARTIKGNGWIGLRFQHKPCEEPSEIVIHVNMKDTNNRQQQEAIGILGVNILYACYHYRDNMEQFVHSLIDGIKDRVYIDMIRVSGKAFNHTDNRVLSLYLVKLGLTHVSIIGEDGDPVHASEFLYKKDLLVVRGNFRPPTLVTQDVFEKGFQQFKNHEDVNDEKARMLVEIPIDPENIDENDFYHRVMVLNGLGKKVIVSDKNHPQAVINYMKQYKVQHFGLVLGVLDLLNTMKQKLSENLDGRLLVAFGEMFTHNIRIYTYPILKENGEILTNDNLEVPEEIKYLYQHLLQSKQIINIENYNPEYLNIYSWEVLESIRKGTKDWEKVVPKEVVPLIKVGKFFK